MFLRGTSNRNKSDIAQEIEGIGARFDSDTGREISRLSLQVMRPDVNRAVKLLGDLVSNSRFDANELELVREEVH